LEQDGNRPAGPESSLNHPGICPANGESLTYGGDAIASPLSAEASP
jgi:hypothetical protein